MTGSDRPRLLDLFCGAGGASTGYHRAGFDVIGVDSEPQPGYPFTFVQADATTYPLDGFDAVAASPPCHDHSDLRTRTGRKHGTGWMLAHTIDRLRVSTLPFVVENVETADMSGSTVLCGTHFALGAHTRTGYRHLKRHRRFLGSFEIPAPGTCTCRGMLIGGVYGDGGGGPMTRGWKYYAAESRAAMGIDWMTRSQLSQAIPPVYTQWVGYHLLAECYRRWTGRPAPC